MLATKCTICSTKNANSTLVLAAFVEASRGLLVRLLQMNGSEESHADLELRLTHWWRSVVELNVSVEEKEHAAEVVFPPKSVPV